MYERRKDSRSHSIGRAYLDCIPEGDVFLKNLSITGCCLECASNTENIKLNEVYPITIAPENESKISKFYIQAKCMWIHKSDSSCEIGFSIVFSPKGKDFQNYVDYLSYHSNT
jgi:hypothetical protein